MYLMILSKKLMEEQLKFLICMVAKRDLIGDILELKLEYVEKTSLSIDLAVDGDDGVLLDEVVSVDDGAHTEIWGRFADMGTGRDAAKEDDRAVVKSLISLSLDSISS